MLSIHSADSGIHLLGNALIVGPFAWTNIHTFATINYSVSIYMLMRLIK